MYVYHIFDLKEIEVYVFVHYYMEQNQNRLGRGYHVGNGTVISDGGWGLQG